MKNQDTSFAGALPRLSLAREWAGAQIWLTGLAPASGFFRLISVAPLTPAVGGSVAAG